MSPSGTSNLVEVERRCFLDTGNPMHVWAAYRMARVADAPIPDWVLRYFDICGDRLLALSADASRNGGAKDMGPKIAKSLGLVSNGRGSPLVSYHADWIVFGANVRARVTDGDKEYLAIESVAKDAGVSTTTVRDAWVRFGALFPGESPFPDEAL